MGIHEDFYHKCNILSSAMQFNFTRQERKKKRWKVLHLYGAFIRNVSEALYSDQHTEKIRNQVIESMAGLRGWKIITFTYYASFF